MFIKGKQFNKLHASRLAWHLTNGTFYWELPLTLVQPRLEAAAWCTLVFFAPRAA